MGLEKGVGGQTFLGASISCHATRRRYCPVCFIRWPVEAPEKNDANTLAANSPAPCLLEYACLLGRLLGSIGGSPTVSGLHKERLLFKTGSVVP
eukprot:2031186-Pyramimonas_sp.AAC.1